MIRRKVCNYEKCNKSLRIQNKSGYCNFHWLKVYRKKYRVSERQKLQVNLYNKSLRLLKNNHKEEFFGIYENLLEEEDSQKGDRIRI